RRARLGSDVGANNFREDFMRATLTYGEDDLPVATPFSLQDSSMMSALARADCLIRRPPDAPAAKQGDVVEVIPLASLG
ncbi:MAG: molybdopterin molybdotransferase, partial [Alphaproteobacteria bacterium]